ncbi:MAG TPA: tetratricopeptide repeat protein, partial [Xanthobacteraceae bacterium]|nr:tetratricopeptide repeat protein [Xanthobacteraceae bacterium]
MDLLQEALALHRRGAVVEAAARYAEVLRTDPGNADAHYYLGMISCQHGRFAEGAEHARQSLVGDPRHVRAHVLFGRALTAIGRREEALACFDKAISLAPDLGQAHGHRADVLCALGRSVEAVESYDRALALAPDALEDWFNRGAALLVIGRHDDAITSFDRVIAEKPDFAEAHLLRAKALLETDRHGEALEGVDRVLAIEPRLAEAWLGRGNVLMKLKRYEDALAAFDRALAFKPDHAEAWLGRGNILSVFKRFDDALAAYDKTLVLKPDLAEAWVGRGNLLLEARRYGDAIAAYDRALAGAPDLAEAWLGRGHVLNDIKQYDNAAAAYDRALALAPDLAEAWLGHGNIMKTLGRHDAAFAAYDRALALKADLAEAWLGRGNVFHALKRFHDAIAAYDKALVFKPDLAEAWLGRGAVFFEAKRYDDAVIAHEKALALRPDLTPATGTRLFAKLLICDWTDLEAEAAELLSAIRERKPSSIPFTIPAIPSSAADQLQCARRYVQDQPTFPPIWQGEVYAHDRIRVAYLSADFCDHAVAQMTVGLFEHHDKSRFEVTGVSFGPEQDSPMRQRLKRAFEHFVDVRDKSDQEIADLIRRLEIDIAIDLTGFTLNNRLNVFTRRPAPIQVNYLGYPGTMGSSYIDYILADSTIIQQDQCAFYDERVIWLPESYQVNDDRRAISADTPTRAQCGLPDTGFVYCCFNNSYKINPAMFDIWMRLLQAVEGSVLWLKDNGATVAGNLRREAERRGVAAERLIFAERVPLMADHLARYRLADLFLDTLPYNAHTTASDALSAGVPVLTCLGSTFAGRVAASVLHTIGLDDLVARSLDEYEQMA